MKLAVGPLTGLEPVATRHPTAMLVCASLETRLKRDSKLIRMIPSLRSLVCLSRGFPIVGAPVCLCGDGEVVGDCCSLLMCFQIDSIQINSNL